jgi:hypothetical protein
MPKFNRLAARALGAAAVLVVPATLAMAQSAATVAEADGKGRVNVKILYYADQGCTTFANVREGAPGNIQPPTRTLVVTVTLDRKPGECVERPYTIEHTIAVADRADALSVDIFYVDPDGRFVRSQRPRIYRDLDVQECEVKSGASKPC